MKLSLLILSVLLVACRISLAGQDERFVESSWGEDQTLIFDLSTVRVIQPRRFTIVGTLIDNGEKMAFELRALDTLRTYCKRPDGKYPPPSDLFTLGPPDLPVKNIEVETKNYESPPGKKDQQYKAAHWHYPYKRLTFEDIDGTFPQMTLDLTCKYGQKDEWDLYREARADITDGKRSRYFFDCKRGLYDLFGVPFIDGEEPSAGLIQKLMDPKPVPPPNTNGYGVYRDVCLRVTHEKPYSPE